MSGRLTAGVQRGTGDGGEEAGSCDPHGARQPGGQGAGGLGGGPWGRGTDWLLKHPPNHRFPLLAFCFSLAISVNRQTREEIHALKASASICQQHVFKAQGVFFFFLSFKKYICGNAYHMLL